MEKIEKWAAEFQRGLMDKTLEVFHESADMKELMQGLFGMMAACVCSYVEALFSELSSMFYEDKKLRKKLGLKVKDRDRIKTIMTEYGEVKLPRPLFMKGDGSCISPILDAAGIEAYQKLERGLQEKLVTQASEESYEKSAAHCGGAVTRQSAARLVRRCTCPQTEVPDELAELLRQGPVREIDVYIDEDHLALQKDGKRKRTILPLAVLAAGKYEECSGRTRLKGAVRFACTDAAELTDTLEGFICAHFDLNELKTIRVHGDGAHWICSALNSFPQTVHVHDGFHITKALRTYAHCALKQKRAAGRLQYDLKKRIQEDRQEDFLKRLRMSAARSRSEKAPEKARKLETYAVNHWDQMVLRFQKDMPGSCTEAQVQHISAARLSSLPCAWSEQGADRLARFRALVLNGQQIHLSAGTGPSPYCRYVQNYVEKLMNERTCMQICEPIPEAFDRNSGTQIMLALLDKGGFRVA